MPRPRLPILADEAGLSAVEFALVLPLLVVFLCGVVEYGWVMKTRMALHHAVSEGTRMAIRFSSPTDRENAARSQTIAVLAGLTNPEVAAGLGGYISVTESPGTSDLPKRFSLSVTDWPYVPLVGLIPAPSRLSANAVMALPD